MMRILLTNFHPFDGGGHTTYIKTLLQHTSAVDYHVACPATSKLFKEASILGIPTHPIDFPGKLREAREIFKNAAMLRRLIHQHKYDIIHVNGSPDHRLVVYALLTIPRENKPKIVFTKHNCFPLKNHVFSRLRFNHFCDAFIGVCDNLVKEFDRAQCNTKVTKHIPNGVDVNHYKPPTDQPSLSSTREALGLDSSKIIFVSCAGTAMHKGWHLLVSAASKRDDVQIIVLGPPPPEQKLSEVLIDTPEGLVLFPGNIEDVRPYLWAADVGFVLSTDVETISFACREMMAAGIPCLVSDTGCLRENITPETGWVVPKGDRYAISRALDHIVGSDLKLMGQKATQRALVQFESSKFVQETVAVYRSII